jgi:hopanoid biosynthesis associated radical SAM protein HpnH
MLFKDSSGGFMAVPLSQVLTVATYVLKQKLAGRKQYPLVLMLEPLFRCNLACSGCGKIQFPARVLRQQLSPEECFRAAEECGAPMVSIPGGEPLLHPQIGEIVAGLVARRKYVYLCTNALLLKKKLHLFKPSKYLTFSVHLDGQKDEHDASVCQHGVFDTAMEGIIEALSQDFRVTTNTTLFNDADPTRTREFFDQMMKVGVEGMVISPGYSYEKAPNKDIFLARKESQKLFQALLSNRKRGWKFNTSPLFLEFLMGKRDYSCTPWGNPAYNVFGWQKPCYLLGEGYVNTFAELIKDTEWSNYGTGSGNPKCNNCMVSCGYEPSSVDEMFSSVSGLFSAARATLFNRYADKKAKQLLAEWPQKKETGSLVQIGSTPDGLA